ncbi:hypothetical protein AALH30_19150 [Blautia pseudococcoides]|uniref:hypothetical protein n=1 Tax=Blautia pseudococcoides TaxID=1796616 RepID=UPI00148AEC5F|nr:hypothetical protein [Blautia pseudococcoides]QJU15733.1 hypothetical protein HL650_15595 [Blautia pseudococcoides]
MKDMIYYPGFETRDENWLKFALLYFDTLRPIIPYTIYSEERYLSDTFQYVMGETDLIKPYRPEYEEGFHASILACEEFEKFLLHPGRYGAYFYGSKSGAYIEKWKNQNHQDCTLFSGKYSQTFFDFCIDNNIATPCREGIHISNDLAFVYMSILADIISKRQEYEMITDVQKYSRYLINKDLTVSRENQKRIMAAQNNIEFSLPANLNHIPLKQFVQLRKDRSFNTARKAYMSQIEQLIAHQESGEFFSLEDLLSYKKDLIKIGQQSFAFTASAIVSCFSFYSLFNGKHNAIVPAVASAVMDGITVRDTCSNLPQYVNSIKEKYLARKYVASIENINRPVYKRWWR